MSNRSVRAFVAVLGVASALVAGGAAIATSAASAFPVRICSPEGCKTVCRQALPNGGAADYDEGAEVTVTHPNGDRATYTCRNGEWVRTTRTRVPVSDLVASPGSAELPQGGASPLVQGTLSPSPSLAP